VQSANGTLALLSRHRSPASLTLIDALVELGNALGYYSDSEFAVTDTGGAVDVAWCQDPTDIAPLFIFEVETAASSSAANNPLKIFGQTSADLANPLFMFHVFMSRSENSERIKQLETQYGTQNYRTYRLGLDEATGLVTDVLEQHRRVRNSVHILGLIRALGHDGWSTVNVHEVLEHVEKNGFRACYVPHYARLAYDPAYRHHFVRELIRREPYPWPTSDHDCWYTTWLGEMYSPPLHLGIVAREHPEREESAVAKLRVWQEERDIALRQIGPYLGLGQEYDYFILGIAAPLWAVAVALFPGEAGRRYCAEQLRFLVDGFDRIDPSISLFSAVWLLWVAAAAGSDEDYGAARKFVSDRGGINARLLADPPSILIVEREGSGEVDDQWWELIPVDPVAPPSTLGDFRESFMRSPVAAHPEDDCVRLALDALTDDSTMYYWAPRITAALAATVHHPAPAALT
jgi:hypothetical protein